MSFCVYSIKVFMCLWKLRLVQTITTGSKPPFWITLSITFLKLAGSSAHMSGIHRCYKLIPQGFPASWQGGYSLLESLLFPAVSNENLLFSYFLRVPPRTQLWQTLSIAISMAAKTPVTIIRFMVFIPPYQAIPLCYLPPIV